MLGVFWKKDRGNEGLGEAGWFISERAGGEDRRKMKKKGAQQTSEMFDVFEVIKATCGGRNNERTTER